MVKFDKEKAWELENMLKLVLEGIYDDDIFCSVVRRVHVQGREQAPLLRRGEQKGRAGSNSGRGSSKRKHCSLSI